MSQKKETQPPYVIEIVIEEKQEQPFLLAFRILVASFLLFYLFIFRIYGIPTISAQCVIDRGHKLLSQINELINMNKGIGNGLLISSSLGMDIVLVSMFIYWILKARSLRLLISLFCFYSIRWFHLIIFSIKFPEGFFFEYPGFPSLSVPYGRQSDFFFSGHCGCLMLIVLEWRKLQIKKMYIISLITLIYVAFTLVSVRAHYTIDISAGIVYAHYIFILIDSKIQQIDNYGIYFQSQLKTKIQTLIQYTQQNHPIILTEE